MSKLKATILLAILVVLFTGLNAFAFLTRDRQAPRIDIPVSITDSEYEEGESEKELLRGVTATDNRSGDVSDTLRVSDVLLNGNGKSVTITYTAKDKANNVSSESIVLKKKD